jgi:hypothetical protein
VNPADRFLPACREAMIPEPLIIETDADGSNPRWRENWNLPQRTWIDVHNLYFRGWVVIDRTVSPPIVKILIGDHQVIYERVGYGLHGEWICDLRWTPNPVANAVSNADG